MWSVISDRGPWFVAGCLCMPVGGQWSVAYGLWSLAGGLWSVVGRLLLVVCDLWSVVGGRWLVVCGWLSVVGGLWCQWSMLLVSGPILTLKGVFECCKQGFWILVPSS